MHCTANGGLENAGPNTGADVIFLNKIANATDAAVNVSRHQKHGIDYNNIISTELN